MHYRIEKKWYVVNIPHEVHLLDLSCCILVKKDGWIIDMDVYLQME